MELIFTKSALTDLKNIAPNVQRRIINKLRFYVDQKELLRFAERLKNYDSGDYRFRIGDYRVIFDIDGDKVIILKVGHRKDIYR